MGFFYKDEKSKKNKQKLKSSSLLLIQKVRVKSHYLFFISNQSP